MDKVSATQKLGRQLALIAGLKSGSRKSEEFLKWQRGTLVAIKYVFGGESDQSNEFARIRWTPSSYSMDNPDPAFQAAWLRGLDHASGMLKSMIEEVDEFWSDPAVASDGLISTPRNSISALRNLCLRFNRVVRQLKSRRANRPIVEVNDEYDVQYLMNALLKLYFDDVRPEEWTPSYAGGSSRMDFLLKAEKTVLEIKKTRKGLGDKAVGDELAIDIMKYKSHPDCAQLVCFVYDPDHELRNPASIETDLTTTHDGLDVIVVVAPQ